MKADKTLISTSKFLSLVLRHRPEVVGMKLDDEGWLDINKLIANANETGRKLTLELLHEVVATNDKQRFALSDDGLRIRANQGHSVSDVDLNLTEQTPPETLYHGTVAAFLASIQNSGLQKRSRNHVHLSADEATATKVGSNVASQFSFALLPEPCIKQDTASISQPTGFGWSSQCRLTI